MFKQQSTVLFEAGALGRSLSVTVDRPPAIVKDHFRLGASRNPEGHAIAADSQSLLRDGERWLPVMGEFHYARYPASDWRDELLKMKLGGIDIVASYIFWIHHEEIEDEFDWTGERSLRDFVALCGALGLKVVTRCGPWCHGECRNGGLPDWLLRTVAETRSDDSLYLRFVERFYGQIALQLDGLLWKQGGPVIGVQIENEYGGPAEHLLNLKRIAMSAGLDVPLYTRTGWPELSSRMPVGELLPLFGGYPDGFWDRSLAEMPSEYPDSFLFRLTRRDGSIATDQLGARESAADTEDRFYPYFACEIGGGMASSYHRRIHIAPKDIEALGLVKLGSGNNLQGYYMYHGGVNPQGRLSTLQESQATGYWNDLPIKSYDYQAPLGEFGQVRPHYHLLRRMHLFVRDFGSRLATMSTHMPTMRPKGPADDSALNWSVRSDGESGFLFISNYQRLQPRSAKRELQFEIDLGEGRLLMPSEPIDIEPGGMRVWPFNMDMDGITLLYVTAQPICRLRERTASYYAFAATDSCPAEFAFAGNSIAVLSSTGDEIVRDEAVLIRNVKTGPRAGISLTTRSGYCVHIIVLDQEESLSVWKASFMGRERLFLTSAELLVDEDSIRLRSGDPEDLTVSIFPNPGDLSADGSVQQPTANGLFSRYAVRRPKRARCAVLRELVYPAAGAPIVRMGSQGVAEPPDDSTFERHAAVWRLRMPQGIEARSRARLRIRYAGDVARVRLDGILLTDNFYNGDVFEVGLDRWAPQIYYGDLRIEILPLREDAPIYLPQAAKPSYGDACWIAELYDVEVIERHEAEYRPVARMEGSGRNGAH